VPEEEPEEEDTTITKLFLEFDTATLGPTGSTTTSVSAQLANGAFTDTVIDEDYSSDDTSVATVSSVGTVFAQGVGTADITATVSTVDGPVSDTEEVTVEQSEQPVTVPGQPSDAARVRFPFSIFNAIPGIEEAEDFVVTIPQLTDIGSTVDSVVPSLQQIATAVDAEITFPEFPDIPQPPSLAGIGNTVFATLDNFGVPTLTEVTATINAELRGLDIPSVDEITAPIDETISDVQQDINSSIDGLLTDIDQSIASVDRFIQDGIDGLQSAVDDVQRSIDTAVEDIDSGFSDVQEAIDELPDSVPSLEDIVADTTAAVITAIEEEIIPTQEGVLLTDDPPRFFAIAIENFLQEALSESTKRQIGNSVGEER
jgi:archaellum component FlaC